MDALSTLLTQLGLGHLEERFRSNGIDGTILDELNDENLTLIGIDRVGDRLRILKEIPKLKERSVAPEPQPMSEADEKVLYTNKPHGIKITSVHAFFPNGNCKINEITTFKVGRTSPKTRLQTFIGFLGLAGALAFGIGAVLGHRDEEVLLGCVIAAALGLGVGSAMLALSRRKKPLFWCEVTTSGKSNRVVSSQYSKVIRQTEKALHDAKNAAKSPAVEPVTL